MGVGGECSVPEIPETRRGEVALPFYKLVSFPFYDGLFRQLFVYVQRKCEVSRLVADGVYCKPRSTPLVIAELIIGIQFSFSFSEFMFVYSVLLLALHFAVDFTQITNL